MNSTNQYDNEWDFITTKFDDFHLENEIANSLEVKRAFNKCGLTDALYHILYSNQTGEEFDPKSILPMERDWYEQQINSQKATLSIFVKYLKDSGENERVICFINDLFLYILDRGYCIYITAPLILHLVLSDRAKHIYELIKISDLLSER